MRPIVLFSSVALASTLAVSANADGPYALTFTKLTGVTGGSIPGTAVYRADLTSLPLSEILSITIQDNSADTAGAAGVFSGFDLDAIVLSYTSVGTAAAAQGLGGLGVFNFTPAGTLFTPGTQIPPVGGDLFGTAGNTVNNTIATLGLFDGESTTVTPDGFFSMGKTGKVSFNLTAPVSTDGLYLYIGEVGDNGEVVDGSITVSSSQQAVPEPFTMTLGALGLGVALAKRRRRA